MIKIEASVSKGWLHKFGGFDFTDQYYLNPIYRWEQDSKINEFVREKFPRFAIYNMEANLVQARYVRDNQVLVGAIQPNMILATLLGARFSFSADKDADVSGRPLEFISDINNLPSPESILEHSLIKDLDKQILNIGDTLPELRAIPPFFWDESGRATIHGIITTSLKLTGDNIMIIMMSDPDLAHAIHQWIVDAYVILINHFAGLAELPVTSVHVGECAGTMISSELYEEFVVPYISQLGNKLGAVRLHTCGVSDHILGAISHIQNLKIIDTGSGTSVAKIRELMGPDFEINVAPPLEFLLDGIPQSEILDWLDKTLTENQNGPLQIAYHIETDYDIRNCLVIHEELEKRGLISNTRLY
ncbi:MAG: uroporphyrinogen decarboxylase family protein [Bacteroidales bacterium]|nr:uroporphyrinogen decarboxylase family protein [Bacteroidales bacterium]